MNQVEELAGFLDTISFDYFCTFTTRNPIGLPSARRKAEAIATKIEAGKKSSFFWAAEKFDLTYSAGSDPGTQKIDSDLHRAGRYHFHGLIKDSELDKFALFDWYTRKFGRCQIIDNREPDRQLAASHYFSKYITKSLSDYDIYLSPGHRYDNPNKGFGLK